MSAMVVPTVHVLLIKYVKSATQLGLIDSNAVVEIRDIFARNRTEQFEANEFDNKAVKAAFDKLVQYVSA